MPGACGLSVLVGTGDKVWSGLYIITSTVGFVVLLGLVDIFYINPFHVEKWWYKGLLFLVCMVVSVVVFGGLVIVLWHLWEKESHEKEKSYDVKAKEVEENFTAFPEYAVQENLARSFVVRYGSRPDFKGMFS